MIYSKIKKALIYLLHRYVSKRIAKKSQRKVKKLRPRPISGSILTRRPYRRDYFKSPWWDIINDPYVRDPSSHVYKKFRTRFRVPFPLYERLLEMAQVMGFKMQPVSKSGTLGIPLQLQILAVLRVLGRATCFDGIEEITGGSAEAHRVFFHKFCEQFSKRYYEDYVYLPRSEQETAKWASDYARMGLTGAIGSTDGVHVHWEKCPYSLINRLNLKK